MNRRKQAQIAQAMKSRKETEKQFYRKMNKNGKKEDKA